jgi:hypothetical protein
MRLGFFALAMLAAAACTFTLPEVQPSVGVDADAGPDAGTDAAAEAEAAAPPPPFCDSAKPKHAFCKDFDDGEVVGGWTYPPPLADPALYAVATTDFFVSPKYAGRFGVHGTSASLSPDDTSTGGRLELPTKGATALHLSFAMRLEALAQSDQFILLYIGTTAGDLRNEVTGLDGKATTITTFPETLTDAGSGVATVWSAAPDVGVWTTVTVDFTVSPPVHYTIKLTDASGTEKTVADADLEGDWTGDAPGFAIGMPFIAGHAHDKSILLDNIAFDVDHP